ARGNVANERRHRGVLVAGEVDRGGTSNPATERFGRHELSQAPGIWKARAQLRRFSTRRAQEVGRVGGIYSVVSPSWAAQASRARSRAPCVDANRQQAESVGWAQNHRPL